MNQYIAIVTDPGGTEFFYGPFSSKEASDAWMQGRADDDRENGPGYKYKTRYLYPPA